MIFGVTIEKLVVIGVIAAMLLGPERLPKYAAMLAQFTVRAREMLSGAKDRMRDEMGDDLDDIDWRKGELLVRGKGNRRDRLPLPEDVGAAISAYLRDARPSTTTRVLFVRSYAPHLGFKDSRIIGKLLARACAALKIEMPARCLGSHVLRHSLATRMVRSGVALNEVGDVLRHKSRATTMIYAKLDIANLRSVAQPWPMEEVLK